MTRVLPFILLLTVAGSAHAQNTDRGSVAGPAPTPTADESPELVKTYQESITASDMAAHLYFFASDFFEGRETATRGQKMAAEYLAGQYRRMGIEPAGTMQAAGPMDPKAYFQPFGLHESRLQELRLSATGGEESVFGLDGADGHSYVVSGDKPELEGNILFAGYGISDPDAGYDDLAATIGAGLNADGRWLMMIDGEPTREDGSMVLTADGSASLWSQSSTAKMGTLSQMGRPIGYLIVQPGSSFADDVEHAAYRLEAEIGSLSLGESTGTRRRRPTPTVFAISESFANSLLASTGRTISDIQRAAVTEKTSTVLDLGETTLKASMTFETRDVSSENVVAFVEGSDPVLKDEYVVVSSHYDHVGLTFNKEGDQVFNGADDDGSGTVTVLEIAEAFGRAREAGHGPRRSIVFINVSGEEKGLLGSRFYTDTEPIFPLERTVTNLNIDMVGRHDPTYEEDDPNYVYIIGSNLISQELHDINDRMNSLTGTNVVLSERFNSKADPNQFYRRSDHWNFGKNNIPFIFFFTGTHEDYHGEDDEPDKIDYERMAQIGRLIFATAWQVANQDMGPAVSGTGFN